MPAKPNPVAVLAERLVEIVRGQRDQGHNHYPLRLSDLAALSGPDTDPATLARAIKHKSFSAAVLLAQKKNPNTLLVLKEDADRLSGSDTLLVDLMEQLCTPESPVVQPAKLEKKIEAPLRHVFNAVIMQRLTDGTLPQEVAATTIKNKRHLFLTRMPPPTPPKSSDLALVDALLHALRTRGEEREFVPWTLAELRSQVGKDVDDKRFKKALGSKALKSRLAVASKDSDAPVALVDESDRLVASAALLEYALRASRAENSHAVSIANLKKKVNKELQPPFTEALELRIARHSLPQGIGVLKIGGQSCFFFWSDVLGSPSSQQSVEAPQEPSPLPPSLDFASAFEQVFDSLNRQHDSHNLVSLVELRRALPVDRATFDDQLRELRRTGRFSLSGAEGRHGLTEEEQEAAIDEGGSLLLYVARR